MPVINPYLNFDGTAREAMEFYREVFGGEPLQFMTFGDTGPEGKFTEEEKKRIMHVSLKIGGNMLMASDIAPSFGQVLNKGNYNYISVSADSREDADKYFSKLSEGGTIEIPMEDMFWGDYFGSFIDKYGIPWMISYANPQ